MARFDQASAEALEEFMAADQIGEIVAQVRSGKEATVFWCTTGKTLRDEGFTEPYIAAKVYKQRQQRSFRNNAIYQAGRVQYAGETRIHRALRSNSDFGKKVAQMLWVWDEWQMMNHLYRAGVSCPQPLAYGERAILMSFIGDESGAAPQLREAPLTQDAAEDVLRGLFDAITRMLDAAVVHGDLSPFNVLFDRGRVVVIDFPQAVDARLNPAAGELLRRDIENVCAWAAEYEIDCPADEVWQSMWAAFERGDLA